MRQDGNRVLVRTPWKQTSIVVPAGSVAYWRVQSRSWAFRMAVTATLGAAMVVDACVAPTWWTAAIATLPVFWLGTRFAQLRQEQLGACARAWELEQQTVLTAMSQTPEVFTPADAMRSMAEHPPPGIDPEHWRAGYLLAMQRAGLADS